MSESDLISGANDNYNITSAPDIESINTTLSGLRTTTTATITTSTVVLANELSDSWRITADGNTADSERASTEDNAVGILVQRSLPQKLVIGRLPVVNEHELSDLSSNQALSTRSTSVETPKSPLNGPGQPPLFQGAQSRKHSLDVLQPGTSSASRPPSPRPSTSLAARSVSAISTLPDNPTRTKPARKHSFTDIAVQTQTRNDLEETELSDEELEIPISAVSRHYRSTQTDDLDYRSLPHLRAKERPNILGNGVLPSAKSSSAIPIDVDNNRRGALQAIAQRKARLQGHNRSNSVIVVSDDHNNITEVHI